ncbi:hypothetical protein [Methylophaga sp.]|jgi:YHS domain-containing protein|uniref:hypothetical protein n=1 Tax=Methylophaga sp. TaxID=2024840 RepID=UPI0025F6FCC9|nr:hypothetical protein [Methylophaga sp.]MDX1751252.1 hypothetical protein [Methylophaga sp.]
MPESKKCPVCNMSVPNDSFSFTLRGLVFWFCSQQCQDRFNQRPSLYVGDPKHGKSSMQQGIKVIKKHTIELELADDYQFKSLLIEALSSLMGVLNVKINRNKLEIEYDLMQVSLQEIQEFILSTGLNLDQSWLNKIHSAYVNLNEHGELDNLGHPFKKDEH